MATKPSLALIPSGYKASTVYSVLPTNVDGDFDFSRTGTATRINKDGLIETADANIPRLDYSDSGCPSLLLESERTNYIPYSEDFDTGWDFFGGSSTLTNQSISPDGKLTADKLISNGSNFGFTRPSTNPSVLIDETTFSIFVKADNKDEGWLRLDYGTKIYNRKFNLTTQTFSTGFDNIGNIPDSEQIIDYGNGWFRLIITASADSTSFEPRIYVTGNTVASVNDSLFLWGSQVETGSYASSYIPTLEGGIATRYADECNRTNIQEYIGQTEGTLFLDFEYLMDVGTDPDNDDLRDIIYFGGTPAQNEIPSLLSTLQARATYYENANGTTEILEKLQGSLASEFITIDNYRSQFRVFVRGSNMTDVTLGLGASGSALANTRYKLAIKYKSGDFKCYRNGVLIGSNSGILNFSSTLTNFYFSWYNGAFDNQKRVNDLRIYKTGLTDQELIELTTI